MGRPYNGNLDTADLLKRLDEPDEDKIVVSNLLIVLQLATLNQQTLPGCTNVISESNGAKNLIQLARPGGGN